jgi:hypothetical protein
LLGTTVTVAAMPADEHSSAAIPTNLLIEFFMVVVLVVLL